MDDPWVLWRRGGWFQPWDTPTCRLVSSHEHAPMKALQVDTCQRITHATLCLTERIDREGHLQCWSCTALAGRTQHHCSTHAHVRATRAGVSLDGPS